jgi:hypothetical protein
MCRAGQIMSTVRSWAPRGCLAQLIERRPYKANISLQASQADRLARLATVDEESLKVVQRVVNAVRADPEEGDDGELYVAMGYVRKRDRKTSLQCRRKVRTAEAPHQ